MFRVFASAVSVAMGLPVKFLASRAVAFEHIKKASDQASAG